MAAVVRLWGAAAVVAVAVAGGWSRFSVIRSMSPHHTLSL